MKGFSPGLSDSIASGIANPPQCRDCGSSSRVGGGLCVRCLLQAGLEPDDECAPELLMSAFAEITLADKNWRLGNYEILGEIGRGGMGVIYRARQRHSRRIVAVKRVLGYHADSHETLARFRREAQAAASLDHPNILPIYEVSESEEGLPFFSMKFAPGGSLQEASSALRDEPRQCVALVAKVARAVHHAHGQGILHRDLKPGNILLDGRGEPLVSDFGLAKWLDTTSDLTRTLTIFGTPGYIAPEQSTGLAEQLSPAADVYSLGAILFDLVAGRPPFLGSHALSVIRQASESPAPKLRSLSRLADRDLETICARCLEREPSARYASARDLAEDLERWLEGRPIVARPVSPAVRAWRWSVRNPKLAVSFAACILLGTVALLRHNQNRELAARVREQALAHHSVGVLPFLDLDAVGPDKAATTSLGGGLVAMLEKMGPARVLLLQGIPATYAGGGSPADLREAGQHAKTRTILTGTTRKTPSGKRIAIRLMDASTGDALFSQSFEEESILRGNSDELVSVAGSIYSLLNAQELKSVSETARDPGLVNEQTRDLIVAGRDLSFRYKVDDYDRAIICFEKAIALEPASPIAHAYLSAALSSRCHFENSPGYLERAEREAEEALRLRPNLPEAHRALAGINQGRNRRLALEEHFQSIEYGGLEYRGASAIGGVFQNLGRPDLALRWFDLARHWEVRRGETDSRIGDCWADLGDDTRAEQAYLRAADLHPEMPYGWLGICRLRLLNRQFDEARKVWAKHCEPLGSFGEVKQMQAQIEFFARNFGPAAELYSHLSKVDPSGGAQFYSGISYESALDRLNWKAEGDTLPASLSERIARRRGSVQTAPDEPDILYQLAVDESLAGQTEPALGHLRSAMNAGWLEYQATLLDPRFDKIANDSHFKEILNTVRDRISSMRAAVLSQNHEQEIADNSER